MDVLRIGEKLISRSKLDSIINRILEERVKGLSQKEVARRLDIDRTFISRLEKLGEIRRGNRIAVVGFPVANKKELEKVLEQQGVEYWILLSDEERWSFVSNKSGLELFNEIMEIVARLQEHDVVIVIGSNYRIKLSEALLNREVIGLEIGESPIEGDKFVDLKKLSSLLDVLQD